MGRFFWLLIGVGGVLHALAGASLGYAFANRNYAEPSAVGWTNYVPLDVAEGSGVGISFDSDACLTCVQPLPWLIADITLAVFRTHSVPARRSLSVTGVCKQVARYGSGKGLREGDGGLKVALTDVSVWPS